MKNFFSTPRGNAGIGVQIREAASGVDKGQEIPFEVVINFAINRYEERVRAKFDRMGFKLPDDEPFTAANILERVKKASELEIEDLSKDGIMLAVDKALAKTLSHELGVTVSTVFNGDTLKQEVKAALIKKLEDGSAVQWVGKKIIQRIRRAKTAKNAGLSDAEAKKVANRAYQKKYRRKCEQVWE